MAHLRRFNFCPPTRLLVRDVRPRLYTLLTVLNYRQTSARRDYMLRAGAGRSAVKVNLRQLRRATRALDIRSAKCYAPEAAAETIEGGRPGGLVDRPLLTDDSP